MAETENWEVSHYVRRNTPFSAVATVCYGEYQSFAVRTFFENCYEPLEEQKCKCERKPPLYPSKCAVKRLKTPETAFINALLLMATISMLRSSELGNKNGEIY